MEKALSLVVFIIFSIMLASVENKVNANTCIEGIGNCQQCDVRCKARHGPAAKGACDSKFQLCTCNYPCGQGPSPPQPKKCYGGAGICSDRCGAQCCNQNCAQKYNQGSGFCDSIGNTSLCKCQYNC
ncbi:Defensin-like protein 183 [Arabidopsis thaliana]|uniref:Defensin-like protein 183 n=4 Tax=Arabidopsis TaxID=3701 RepID=DF183_ARATH|nr:low-molecular-weight cysteine-rich 19 [Arabidopsis thaliana]P82733.1 RecName: Full=Defensin-like protein 183; AltName: Full=Low-molecular-weight cysteine-rich protein 19; Short=Protein LCR19; Flags: Precursor [Arabidopsis thaliana]KAG7617854.1 hypothetical protein ISN45_At04g031860 [Arabidopsis thaliana x Arabidopsis arenosa]KAG7622321.1 hypothetical protein ISN44_As04g031300 [Arabidopsis suecica]AEE85717.1 low-molecular-weight cysteine-rich 19 [Arabidopsis thaliana]OAO98871.1 LCR19 [Arabid|eukprot:NP_001031755.1 low-molecular-weight cysteine-rich 19 [Arabidopsis thaliana]